MGRGFGSRNGQEHWTREIFRKWGIPLFALSRRLNLSSPYLSAVLSGSIVASDNVYQKLEQFAYIILQNVGKDPRDKK